MYCIGTIKQLEYDYFGKQAVSIPPCPGLFPSAAPLQINLVSGHWKMPIALITILTVLRVWALAVSELSYTFWRNRKPIWASPLFVIYCTKVVICYKTAISKRSSIKRLYVSQA